MRPRRVVQNISECLKEDGSFDWDEYQYYCDLAEFWKMEENDG